MYQCLVPSLRFPSCSLVSLFPSSSNMFFPLSTSSAYTHRFIFVVPPLVVNLPRRLPRYIHSISVYLGDRLRRSRGLVWQCHDYHEGPQELDDQGVLSKTRSGRMSGIGKRGHCRLASPRLNCPSEGERYNGSYISCFLTTTYMITEASHRAPGDRSNNPCQTGWKTQDK